MNHQTPTVTTSPLPTAFLASPHRRRHRRHILHCRIRTTPTTKMETTRRLRWDPLLLVVLPHHRQQNHQRQQWKKKEAVRTTTIQWANCSVPQEATSIPAAVLSHASSRTGSCTPTGPPRRLRSPFPLRRRSRPTSRSGGAMSRRTALSSRTPSLERSTLPPLFSCIVLLPIPTD